MTGTVQQIHVILIEVNLCYEIQQQRTNWLQVCVEALCLLFRTTGIYSISHMSRSESAGRLNVCLSPSIALLTEAFWDVPEWTVCVISLHEVIKGELNRSTTQEGRSRPCEGGFTDTEGQRNFCFSLSLLNEQSRKINTSRSAYLSTKTGHRGKHVAWLCPHGPAAPRKKQTRWNMLVREL